MAEIAVRRPHDLSNDALRARLAKLEAKLQERLGVTLAWQGDQAKVVGPGVSGSLTLHPGEVSVELKLGLLLRPLIGQIREQMERQLDRALAPEIQSKL